MTERLVPYFEGEKYFDYKGDNIPLVAKFVGDSAIPGVFKMDGDKQVLDDNHTWSDVALHGMEISKEEFNKLLAR